METDPIVDAKRRPTRRLPAAKRVTRNPLPPYRGADRGGPLLEAPPLLDLRKERTITVIEAAYRLGKSEDAIRKWLRRGRLKAWQVGGKFCQVLVSEAAVEEVLRQGTMRFR